MGADAAWWNCANCVSAGTLGMKADPRSPSKFVLIST